jgi:hypothetical protein
VARPVVGAGAGVVGVVAVHLAGVVAHVTDRVISALSGLGEGRQGERRGGGDGEQGQSGSRVHGAS